MLRHYLLQSLRIFNRNRFYFFINVFGLGLGLAGAIMIYTYIQYEESYDQYNLKKDRIYRLTTYFSTGTHEEKFATTYPNVMFPIISRIPEIETGVRLFKRGMLGSSDMIGADNHNFPDQAVYYADSTFFRVFTLPLITGNENTALAGPGKAIITTRAAMRYFGKTDVTGKNIYLNTEDPFIITGVMQDIPEQSHFHFDVLLSMDSHEWVKQANWNGMIFPTYLLLRTGASREAVTKKIDRYIKSEYPEERSAKQVMKLPLQKITDIHLKSDLRFEVEANNDIRYIYIFSTIAFFLVLIAGINYVNLETSRSVSRAGEISLRKVFGAGKNNMLLRFVTESVISTLAGLGIALLLVQFFLPVFCQIAGRQFVYEEFFNGEKWLLYLSLAIVLGVLSGLYPALTVSAFRPESFIGRRYSMNVKNNNLRRSLVILQFTIAMVLVIGTLVVHRQMDYISTRNLGINRENVIALRINSSVVYKNRETLKKALDVNNSIHDISIVSELPVNITSIEGVTKHGANGEGIDDLEFHVLETDSDFLKTMDVDLVAGRNFYSSFNPERPEYILNETAVRAMGFTPDNVLGTNITVRRGVLKAGPVIGVVRDFNYASLHSKIDPLVIWQFPRNYSYLLCRIDGSRVKETVGFIENKWKEMTGLPADYNFLEQDYDNLYRHEQKAGKLFTAFSIITLIIAAMGLLALSSYAATRRTKEIGIRKVLGSSSSQIAFLVIHDNLKSILFAVLFAVPAGYYLSNQWLSDFAFRISPGPGIYLFAVLIILVLSLLTVTWHALKASNTNPVDTLRYE